LEVVDVQRILDILQDEGFRDADFNCHSLDRTLSKANLIFAVRKFSDRMELRKWNEYQDEINRNIYIKVDASKRLDIYFILFLSFETSLEDISILHEIEKDPYYCRKIVIRNKSFDQDKSKLPFVPFSLQEKSSQTNRAQTIKEFLDAITRETNERIIAEKIFEMKEHREIARALIDFHPERRPNSEATKANN
jgi:hypothetical protein